MLPILVLITAAAGADPGQEATSGESSAGPVPHRIQGRWLLDPEGRPVPPRFFERGLQTSGLVFRAGVLWSMGDQRAEWPGQLLRIDPKTFRLMGPPIRPHLSEPPGGNPLFGEYRAIPNSDFEGLALDPKDPSILHAVTEDKRIWLVRLRLEEKSPPVARIEQITPLQLPPGFRSYRDDPNYRFEGIAISDDAKTLYLAWERAADRLPRLFSIPAAKGASGKVVPVREVPMDFAAVQPRPDKARAMLNLNDIQFLRREGRPCLLGVARDQERLLLLDLEKGKVERVVDLDLRAPDGDPIYWVSPEGLAIDEASNRLWLISDPDSIRGNYRKRMDEHGEGNFAAMAPLIFETRLSAALGDGASRK